MTKTENKEDRSYKVYVHTCKVNGKSYVGLTKRKPYQRWRNGNGYRSQSCFWNAIQKYGWDNFEHKIIADNLTAQEASDLEKEMIEKLQSQADKNGYNIELGGIECSKEYSISTTARTCPVYQFDVNYNLVALYDSIKEASQKTNTPSPLIIRVCSGNMNGTNGYIWRYQKDVPNLEEFKNTCDIKLKIQPIYQFDKDFNLIAEHISISQASRDTGVGRCGIHRVCHGLSHTSGGYIWKFKSDIPNLQEYQKTATITKKTPVKVIPCGRNIKVDQYDMDNNFIKTWDSFMDIEKELNIKHSNITKVCKRYLDPEKFKYPLGAKSAGGYIWRYHNEEEKRNYLTN